MRNKVASFSWLAVKRWYITLPILLTLIVGGWYSYAKVLQREGFPAIQFPLTIININSPGTSAETLDEKVAKPLNDRLANNPNIDKIQTTSNENFFSAAVYFEESVLPKDGESITREAFKDIDAPNGSQIIFTTINPAKYLNKYDVLVNLYSTDDQDVVSLQNEAKSLAEDLSKQQYIGDAKVEKLTASGTNPITGQNVEQQLFFNQVGVKENDNLNFYPSVIIGVTREDGADALDISESVNNWIENKQADVNSRNFNLIVGADFAETIKNDIKSLQDNLLSGILAVLVVTFLLISLRSSFIIAAFMIATILATLLIFWIIGYTLNVITLFALVLTLGLFVDDATIMVEALDSEKNKNNNLRLGVKTAGRKVAVASFAGTLTTVLVFLPLAFIGGILGDFIRLMPITVIISLLVSYILSITFVPVLAKFIIFRKASKNKKSFNLVPVEKLISSKLSNAILWLKTKPRRGVIWGSSMIGLSIGLIFCGLIISKSISFNIFPPSKDADRLQVSVDYVPGVTLKQAEAQADKLNQVIAENEARNIEKVVYGGFNQPNNRSAEFSIILTPVEARGSDDSSVQIIERLQPKLTNAVEGVASVRIVQIDAGPPAEQFPFKMQITEENSEKASKLAKDIQSYIEGREITKMNGETSKVVDTKIEYLDGISRLDGKRIVQVSAAFDSKDISALVSAAQSTTEKEFTASKIESYGISPDSISYDFGQESQNAESFKSLSVVFPIAIILMFILLSIQFRSIIQPFLIFLAIPFSFFGIVSGLALTNNALSFFSMVGIIGLVGIAVNNTIMLTDYANQARKNSEDLAQAVSEAVKQRFRPLITTTMTTIFALLPLAIFDPFWQPLAVVIIGGLLSSTILVILAFPFYYYGVTKLGISFRSRLKKLRS